jgi:hypothetical protein
MSQKQQAESGKTINSNFAQLQQAPAYPADFTQNLSPRAGGYNETPDNVILQPLTQFPQDINIPANTVINVPIQTLLGSSCVGFILQNVTSDVFISINGGGFRTVTQNISVDGCQITSLMVNGGVNGCILQLIGV